MHSRTPQFHRHDDHPTGAPFLSLRLRIASKSPRRHSGTLALSKERAGKFRVIWALWPSWGRWPRSADVAHWGVTNLWRCRRGRLNEGWYLRNDRRGRSLLGGDFFPVVFRQNLAEILNGRLCHLFRCEAAVDFVAAQDLPFYPGRLDQVHAPFREEAMFRVPCT